MKNSVLLVGLISLLTGCLGGTVAQQIARSIATSVADNAVANALDVQEIDEQDAGSLKIDAHNKSEHKPKNIVLTDTVPDPYLIAFANARFEAVKPIAEPLPVQQTNTEVPVTVAISSQLVRVELFNLLIGDEKAAVYTKARLMGATTLPKPREWKLWQVATGMMKQEKAQNKADFGQYKTAKHAQFITFLIPPEFGKMPSGSVTLVELANPGELNIARYKVN